MAHSRRWKVQFAAAAPLLAFGGEPTASPGVMILSHPTNVVHSSSPSIVATAAINIRPSVRVCVCVNAGLSVSAL